MTEDLIKCQEILVIIISILGQLFLMRCEQNINYVRAEPWGGAT